MHRRRFTLGLVAILAAGPVLAQTDFVGAIADQLRDQGFSQIEMRRTLLGRTRILATNAEGQREIIVNPYTGEILRDLWQPVSGRGVPRILEDGETGSGKGGGASGQGRSGSSGGNSGGSGSGSGQGGSGHVDDDDDSGSDDRSDDDSDGSGSDDRGGSRHGGSDDDDD